ncbi:unnamed protein product [Sphagnum troendelagicum]|uniref:SMP-LTD domain-containing protein n=1 Tax=Sphagnum troendelagicum TaxID=128251 RepID=A0ABP0UWI6_9BRYO
MLNGDVQGDVWVAPLVEGDWAHASLEPAWAHIERRRQQIQAPPARESIPHNIQVQPILRHGILQDKVLCLMAPDGREETDLILLDGCAVHGISGGDEYSRKWAEKFPIKVHHDERVLFRGCKDFLLYLPTGFEKEAWCEVLRAASKPQHAVKEWFLKYKTQYAKYCHGLAVYNHLVMTNLQRENSGNVMVNEIDLGKYPPVATAFRMLPPDTDGVIILEVDVDYHGDGHFTCETRLEDSGINEEELQNDDDEHVSPAVSENIGWVQSMKAIMARMKEQISQVPLVISIKVVSLKGTLEVRIRPPPTTHIWFSFRHMPELELMAEPYVGDHAITSPPVIAWILAFLKKILQDAMVFPHCENLYMKWMMAEPDDWLPQSTIPVAFSPNDAIPKTCTPRSSNPAPSSTN